MRESCAANVTFRIPLPSDFRYNKSGFFQQIDNADSRHSDLEKLSKYAANFTDILELLQQLSLLSSTDGDPTSSSSTDHRSPITDHDKVTLSSIHQAKGLEWQAALIRSPLRACASSYGPRSGETCSPMSMSWQ
jgi:superfamily I DNA/RNA helicase